MKLAMRPKHWPIGSHAATRSATPEQPHSVGEREAEHRRADADRRAVEAHAAVPDREHLERMGEQLPLDGDGSM